jgi:alpha-galactosidase
MMEVGNLATDKENRSHFAMWAMLSAPLIMGTDVPGMREEVRKILTNPRIVAIDQDPLGIPAFRWRGTPETELWAKPLANGEWAIAALNRSNAVQDLSVDWLHGELRDDMHGRDPAFASRTYRIEESWDGKQVGTTAEPLEVHLEPRDTLVFRLVPQTE